MALPSTKDKKRPLQSMRGKGDKYDLSSVPKNDKGGVLVTEEELAAAFEFFDMDSSGKITMTNLRKRLSVFYKNMVRTSQPIETCLAAALQANYLSPHEQAASSPPSPPSSPANYAACERLPLPDEQQTGAHAPGPT